MREEYTHHFMTRFREQLLRIATVRDGFALLGVPTNQERLSFRLHSPSEWRNPQEFNMPKRRVRDIANEDPPNLENAFPLI